MSCNTFVSWFLEHNISKSRVLPVTVAQTHAGLGSDAAPCWVLGDVSTARKGDPNAGDSSDEEEPGPTTEKNEAKDTHR